MATIKFRLNTISSTVGPDRLDFTVEKSVSITEPFLNMAKASVATGVETVILGTSNVQSYVYIRNTDATNFITIKNAAGNTLSVIRAGEFALFPIAASAGLELLADTGVCVCEYGHWAVA